MTPLSSKKRHIITIVAISIISIISIFCMNCKDCTDIVTWAKQLHLSLIDGRIRYFAVDCYYQGVPTNYSAFSNIICALWLLPISLIDSVLNENILLQIYCVWLKIGILVLNYFVAQFIYKIIYIFNKEISKEIILFLWFSFGIVQWCSLGMGQIDCIGILLMLMAIYFYFDNQFILFSIFSGACLCFKAFPIILIAPLFASLFAKKGFGVVKHGLFAILLPSLQLLVEKLFFIEYDICERVGFEYSNSNFIDRLFQNNWILRISPFVFFAVLLSIIAYILRKNNLIKDFDILFISELIYLVLYITVFCHSQWYLYALAIILVTGLRFYISSEFLLMCFIFNISQIISNAYSPNVVTNSLLGAFINGKDNYEEFEIVGTHHIGDFSASIFFASFFAMALYYLVKKYIYKKHKRIGSDTNRLINSVLIWCIYLCSFLYELIIIYSY